MKIVVDAFGGDHAPLEIVQGALLALDRRADLSVVLVGKKAEIEAVLEGRSDRIEIIDASEVIGCEESPTVAIKKKTDSSMVRALEALKQRDDVDGLVSAGSSGALLTGAFMKIGRIKGISRPALASVVPTQINTKTVFCDCGANVDCKPLNILHFAYMGDAYARAIGIENPRIGLLSNGTEESKGNEAAKEAYAVLKDSKLNFIGYVEGRDLLSGNVDVFVSDGFDGNVLLKGCEGMALTVFAFLKKAIAEGGLKAKIGAMLLHKSLRKVKHELDYNEQGGACFVGVEKVVMKTHGSSKRTSVCESILAAARIAEAGLIDKIKENLTDMTASLEE